MSPRAEWEFIIHTAGLYERMGCDLLALDLVRSWEFLRQPLQPPMPKTPAAKTPSAMEFPFREKDGGPKSPGYFNQPPSAIDGLDIDPRRLLRRRSSLVIADLPVSPVAEHHKKLTSADANAIAEEKEPRETNGVQELSKKRDDEEEEKEKQKKKKPPPTQFVEPDANSLLDSFGF